MERSVKILIVDDSKAMRMIVSRVLRQSGYGHAEFVEGANGVEGLAAVRAGEVDLVLSDWNMPEMNGIDFLRALRAEGRTVRFGFVTSESTADMKEQAVLAGTDFFVTKPFTAEAFADLLGTVVA
jgi:two-component system, chemotaxis family, chemotaxis protein CheY